MPDYVTAGEFRSYLGLGATDNTGNNSDTVLDLYLDEGESWVDWRTGRHFGVVEDEDRDYWGDGTDLLKIDPAYEIGVILEVASDGATTTLETSGYTGRPAIGTFDEPQHTHIQRLPPLSAREYRGDRYDAGYRREYSTEGYANIWRPDRRYRVTGKYGMAAVPPGIKLAVMEMAAIRRIQSPRARQAPQFEEDNRELSAAARNIVDKYLDRWILSDAWNPRGKLPNARPMRQR